MPVNSFDDYILTWKPDKSKLHSPIYLSLAQQMEDDIISGTLEKGTKLPPQRELADYLDISLNTVTRAYSLCEKRGFIYAVTGRGTFVHEAVRANKSIVENKVENTVIHLGMTASPSPNNREISNVIKEIISDTGFEDIIGYVSPQGKERHISAAVSWLEKFGIKAENNILITNGSQNSLTLVLTALFESGDRIVVDQYSYPNFLALANMLHITLVPVASDEHGMNTAELQKVLNTNNIKGIYLSPSCSNPQAICMPENRRKELADLIEKHSVILIEDDCYAFLSSRQLTPIFNMVRGNAIYLTELNKAINLGIRTGYMCYDKKFKAKLEQANYNCNLTIDSFGTEIATRAIEKKIYEKTIDRHRRLVKQRNRIYQKYFKAVNMESYYQWLQLPPGISSTVFETLALKNGIKVYGSERFLTGDSGGIYYLRVSTSTPDTDEQLEAALTAIRKITEDMQSNPWDSYTI